MTEQTVTASGVQDLINKLRDDGVSAGQKQADDIVKEAEAKAEKIIADTRKISEQMLDDAQKQITADKAAAEEALKLAARDTVLRLGTEIRARLEGQAKALVSSELKDSKFLQQVILSIASKTTEKIPANGGVELLVNQGGDDKADTKELEKFIKSLSAETLRSGIDIHTGKGDAGVHIKLENGNLDIQLPAETLADMLTSRLQARFQHLMLGIE